MQEKDEKEGLDETCESYIGKFLIVYPIYGWGWEGNEEAPNPPHSFKFRLERIWWNEGIRRGGIGIIEDPNHKYNGFVIIFDLRHYGGFNFTTKTGQYNIEIVKSKLTENNGWPVPIHRDKSCGGYAEIKVSESEKK